MSNYQGYFCLHISVIYTDFSIFIDFTEPTSHYVDVSVWEVFEWLLTSSILTFSTMKQ